MMRSILDRRSLYRAACAALVLLSLLSAAGTARAQESVRLDRNWQFFADTKGTAKPESLPPAGPPAWRQVRVGLSWNAQFPDLRDYMGVGWYRTRFEVPAESRDRAGRRVLLGFGAVDYFCEVFVNGQRAGQHEGGYTPFKFDITEMVRPGANELVVRVVDPPMDEKDNRARFPEMLYNEIPHGKQNWYVQTGGIWQDVTLDIKPTFYIERLHITARRDGQFNIEIRLGGPYHTAGSGLIPVAVNMRDPEGRTVFTRRLETPAPRILRVEGQIAAPQLWSPASPALYSVEVSLSGKGMAAMDAMTERFGFRSFEARGGKFYLNGEPFYMVAALDQDFYPETIYSAPGEEYIRDMMLKGKRLGLNLLRCHIKVPDPVYLKVADEVGMLVWYEIPSWNDFNHFSPKAATRGERTFAEQVERDWNHPSIVIQSIINESWGADLKQQEQRRWLRGAFDRAARLTAPLGRLIVDNSACCDNFHVRTDIEDNHRYNSMPDDHAAFDKWVADFSTHPKWNFSPHGDAEPTGEEPLVLSEFGNWGLPRLPSALPWWFERDFAGRAVTRPAGLFDRFREFQFATLFRDYNALAEETQWHQFVSLKHEIEEIRSHAPIQGYVITEFTDINWEVNGLMDMWRNPKVYAAELAKIQQPDLILARPQKMSYTSGERIELPILLSHYSARQMTGVRVLWSTDAGGSGRFSIPGPIARASVEPLQTISFDAPQTVAPRRLRLRLEARGRDNSLVAENSYEFFIFPKPQPEIHTALMFYAPGTGGGDGGADKGDAPELSKALRAAGYTMLQFDPANKFGLLITSVVDERVQRYLRGGGRAILLAATKEALPAGYALKVTPRAGSDLDGNWVTNFNWIRTNVSPFREVAFAKVLGFEADAATPRYIIQGVRGADYSDVMSGIFYGWLNNNAALAVQMRFGSGRIFATTYSFDAYGRDPFATHLLDAIVRHTNGQGFAPGLKME